MTSEIRLGDTSRIAVCGPFGTVGGAIFSRTTSSTRRWTLGPLVTGGSQATQSSNFVPGAESKGSPCNSFAETAYERRYGRLMVGLSPAAVTSGSGSTRLITDLELGPRSPAEGNSAKTTTTPTIGTAAASRRFLTRREMSPDRVPSDPVDVPKKISCGSAAGLLGLRSPDRIRRRPAGVFTSQPQAGDEGSAPGR
jgi:hypothetical protein